VDRATSGSSRRRRDVRDQAGHPSSADKAGDAFLDTLVEGKGLVVLKPRPDRPPVPPGATPIENDAWLVFNEADAAEGDALAKDALTTRRADRKEVALDSFEGRKGAIRVMKDQGALDAALRPLAARPAARRGGRSRRAKSSCAPASSAPTRRTRSSSTSAAARRCAALRLPAAVSGSSTASLI